MGEDKVIGYLIVQVVVATVTALLAKDWKHRSPIIWFVIGLLAPLLGLLILCAMPRCEPPSPPAEGGFKMGGRQ